jgi:hypothetical protein
MSASEHMSEETKRLVREHLENCLSCTEHHYCEGYWDILLTQVKREKN